MVDFERYIEECESVALEALENTNPTRYQRFRSKFKEYISNGGASDRKDYSNNDCIIALHLADIINMLNEFNESYESWGWSGKDIKSLFRKVVKKCKVFGDADYKVKMLSDHRLQLKSSKGSKVDTLFFKTEKDIISGVFSLVSEEIIKGRRIDYEMSHYLDLFLMGEYLELVG